ncbi:HEPN domain-containing protein [Candidatus Gottesmanbacteria bacterium]|nr:HEPN domain-containing protein [Candidatus Gottesmanbacteria bacterium]
MNRQKEHLAREWFKSANSDYKYAEIGLREGGVFPQIAFLSQLDECVKIEPKLEVLRDACELLVGFYIESRYPPDISEFTTDDLEDAFAKATFIRETIMPF